MISNTIHIDQTEDGSPTLYSNQFGEHYHSIHGAIQESQHIFIEAGLKAHLRANNSRVLNILEVGFGTGLNALMTAIISEQLGLTVNYTSLELYPIEKDIYEQLQFDLNSPISDLCLKELHTVPWDKPIRLETIPSFTLEKKHIALQDYQPKGEELDLVFFDAFSPEAQPELWSEEIFRRLYHASRWGAVLTTYCAKGEVRRRLQRAGWIVERLAGPPGKREMLRASKY